MGLGRIALIQPAPTDDPAGLATYHGQAQVHQPAGGIALVVGQHPLHPAAGFLMRDRRVVQVPAQRDLLDVVQRHSPEDEPVGLDSDGGHGR